MNIGQTKAAINAPTKGPTIYIQICLIGFLYVPLKSCIKAGAILLAGFIEHPDTLPPITLQAYRTKENAKPKEGPK